MWSMSEILTPVREHFELLNRETREQQAFRGIDSLREIELHPLISQSFSNGPHAVSRESYYPSPEIHIPRGTQRERCDLVILPEGKLSLYDPVDAHKALQSACGTLFEAVATPPAIRDTECAPDQALWIEIKAIAQYRYVDGVPGPNANYTSELITGPSSDVVKLASEPLIRHAAVLVLLFTELKETGVHDLSIAIQEIIDRDLPVGMPEYETFPIIDLGGNAWSTLGLVPLRL